MENRGWCRHPHDSHRYRSNNCTSLPCVMPNYNSFKDERFQKLHNKDSPPCSFSRMQMLFMHIQHARTCFKLKLNLQASHARLQAPSAFTHKCNSSSHTHTHWWKVKKVEPPGIQKSPVFDSFCYQHWMLRDWEQREMFAVQAQHWAAPCPTLSSCWGAHLAPANALMVAACIFPLSIYSKGPEC